MSQQTQNPQQLFELSVKAYQTPSFVTSHGTRVQALFNVKSNPNVAQANSVAGLSDSATVLVCDVSSSMYSQGRIEALRLAGAKAVSLVPEGAKIGVVIFAGAGTAKWLIPLQVMKESQRAGMIKKIQALQPDGNTCFCEPLKMAIDALLADKSAIKQIQFMSDGESTSGSMTIGGSYYSDADAALYLAENKIAGTIGFNVYAMAQYDKDFMADLTAKSGGNFSHILADGTGLDQIMGANTIRAGLAVAANVVVEFRTLSGFTFFADKDGKYELYRTAPKKISLRPIQDNTLMVDDSVGIVNSVEGIPYEAVLVGPVLTAPAGQVSWDVTVALLTVRYELSDGEHTEQIEFVQTFTTDYGQVVTDQSVGLTMRETAMQVQAADLVEAYSRAVTMGDTAQQAAISRQMTMAGENASRSGLGSLSVDLAMLAEGMSTGDVDNVLAKGTRMMDSADLDALLGGGMGTGDNDE